MQCHRHPEREARRKCYRCHKPLCPACQIRALHHLFCSRHCVVLHGVQDFLHRGLRRLSAASGMPGIPAQETRRRTVPIIFLALLSIMVFISQPSSSSPKGFVRSFPGEAFYLNSGSSASTRATIVPPHQMSPAAPSSASPGTDPRGKQVASIPQRMPLENWGFREGKVAGEGELDAAPDISRGSLQRREIALTFDGGGEANVAPEILQTLREKGTSSTFFLSGEFIRRYPELVRQMVADGHEIANHTTDHPHLTTFAINGRHELLSRVDRRFLRQELKGAEELFADLTGEKMAPFWRAPYGEQNATLRRWAKELGYQHISWTSDYRKKKSLDSRDWVADPSLKIYCSAQEVQNRILGYGDGANGGIVLMHLGTPRTRDRVHEKLGEIIVGLRERGYRLVKISELLEGKGEGERL